MLGIYGNHLLHCCYGCQRDSRNKNQVTLLGNELAKDIQQPFIGPLLYHNHPKRPNTRKERVVSYKEFFDITFVNPDAPSYVKSRKLNPVMSFNAAQTEKKNTKDFDRVKVAPTENVTTNYPR